MTVSELLPCPFCGSSDNLFVEPDERGSGGQWVSPIHVGCCQWKGCGVSLTGDDTAEAVAKWNTRAMKAAEPLPQGDEVELGSLKERVRDYIYDCTRDEFSHGWTLSAFQTDDLIAMIRAALVRSKLPIGLDEIEQLLLQYRDDLLYPPDDDSSDRRLTAISKALTAIDSQSIATDETEMCDACDGSGFGVADTYCGKCGGAGGYPLAKDEERQDR